MPKKAKKAKITGTPDVVKFKGTRTFNVLKGLISVQEQRVLMSTDFLEESEYSRISRLVHLLGLLACDLQIEPPHQDPREGSSDEAIAEMHPKDYRFHLHHPILTPSPQLFPMGYSVEVIRAARAVIEKPSLVVNRREYLYREDLRETCDDFLKNLDRRVIEISSFIEVKVKADFKDGLKLFKAEISKQLAEFDVAWRDFERFLLQEKLRVHTLVFQDLENLVKLEADISAVEAKLSSRSISTGAIETLTVIKANLEVEFAKTVTKLINELISPSSISPEAITLAESCLFYGPARVPNAAASGNAVMKATMELRSLIAAGLRLQPELKTNDAFMRALTNFKHAVEGAGDALQTAEKLPRVAGVKQSNFLTKTAFLESLNS